MAAYSAQSTGRGSSPKVMELYVSAQNVMDAAEYRNRLQEAYKRYPNSDPKGSIYDYRARDKAVAAVDRALRREGYDGVWDRESGEMFVYEPEQIKSATDNAGTFDKNNADIRYSMRDGSGNEVVLTEVKIEENKKKIAQSKAVAKIEENRFAKNPHKDFMTMGAEYFEEIGGEAHNPVLGKVILNDSGVRHLISQGVTRRRSAMLEAVKPCIEKGEIIHIENNHKGKRFDTALIAARVELDGLPYYMCVVVRQTNDQDNSYYMHDAVLVQKRRAVDSIQQDTDGSMNAGATRVEPNNPSIASILASIEDYNPQEQENEKQFSLRETVEERADGLIAVHNMRSEELLKTIEELGGFPSPSIAIVKAKDGHSKYGGVSVVFGKETIDPKADSRNKVYSQNA